MPTPVEVFSLSVFLQESLPSPYLKETNNSPKTTGAFPPAKPSPSLHLNKAQIPHPLYGFP